MKQVRDWVAEDEAIEAIHEFVRAIETEIQEMAAGAAEAIESRWNGKPYIRRRDVEALLNAIRMSPSVMIPEAMRPKLTVPS